MTCEDFEILLADSLDGTMPASLLDGFELHRASCPACAGLARDAGSAVAFLGHVPQVVPPRALVNRILTAMSRAVSRPRIWFPQWPAMLGQPQFAMGVALTLLSLAVVVRFWASAGNGAQRAWERTVKGYENMQIVYEAQSQLQDQLQDELREWMNDRAGEAKEGTR
jgi:hypothetical protein